MTGSHVRSARRPRRVVRGLGRAFLYLSIYPGEVSSLRQAHKTTGPRETKTPRLFTSCELCISEAALLARAIGNSPAHTGVRGLTVTRVTGPTSLDHCTEIQSRKRHTSSAATYVSGTPTLGLYQPRAPCSADPGVVGSLPVHIAYDWNELSYRLMSSRRFSTFRDSSNVE